MLQTASACCYSCARRASRRFLPNRCRRTLLAQRRNARSSGGRSLPAIRSTVFARSASDSRRARRSRPGARRRFASGSCSRCTPRRRRTTAADVRRCGSTRSASSRTSSFARGPTSTSNPHTSARTAGSARGSTRIRRGARSKSCCATPGADARRKRSFRCSMAVTHLRRRSRARNAPAEALPAPAVSSSQAAR